MHYFDNAATTFPKPEVVYETMDSFYRNYGVNVGRGLFKEASIANAMVDETKTLLLELFHVSKGNKQVTFTASATEALNLILRGHEFSKGDFVYVSPFEHNAVLRTLYMLKDTKGINVEFLKPNFKTLQFDFEEIKNQFEENTPRMIVLTHASNAFGNILPLKEIFTIAKEYDAVTIADLSQTAGLIDTNLMDCRCDYAVFAGHKTLYGPFGAAGVLMPLYANLLPLIYGGTGVESADPEMPKDEPIRYEAGSHNVLSISGLNASLKWIKEIGIDKIREQEQNNTKRLLELLNRYSNITVYRNEELNGVGVVSCTFNGYSSDSIGQVLSDNDIAVRTGLHCAPLAHDFMGTSPTGTVRFSVNYFTSVEDFKALENVLDYIEINS